MASFTATIPKRPPDAPGDNYPPDPGTDWGNYERRAARTMRPGWNGSFAIRSAGSEHEELILAEGGSEPGPWMPVQKTQTVVGGVKVDYTTFEREYASVTLRRYRKVTVTFRIHYHFMPATNEYDQFWTEIWYSPLGDPYTQGPLIERRTKLTSWGAGVTVGVGGALGEGVEIEVGAELEFSHEGEDLTPPSPHPTPRTRGLQPKPPPSDESLGGAAEPGLRLERFKVAQMLQPLDRQALSADETRAAREQTVAHLAGVDLDGIARAQAAGRYPGLVRYLIGCGQPESTADVVSSLAPMGRVASEPASGDLDPLGAERIVYGGDAPPV